MRPEERPRGVRRKVADTTGLDFSNLLEDVDSDPSGIVGAEWIFPPGAYNTDPIGWQGARNLHGVGVSPKEWSDHLGYSELRNIPWSAPSEERYNAAYDKAANLMDKTSVVDDSGLSKAWDVSKLIAGALKHQAESGWENLFHVGQKTQDNRNPNWVDLQGNVRAIMDTAYNPTRGVTDTSVWNPGQISVNDFDTRIQPIAREPTGGYVNQVKSFISKALEGLRRDPIESDASAIQGAAGVSTADLLRRALTDQGLQQDARKIKPLAGSGLLSAALRNVPRILGKGLGWGSAFVPSPMDGRRYTDDRGRVVTPDGSMVTLTDELLGATVGRGSVPTGTADRLIENRLSMIPFAINPATDRYEETYPPYFNEVVSGQPGPGGPVRESKPTKTKSKPKDDSNARQAREAAAKVTKKKKSTAALIADTKTKRKTATAAKVTAAKAQDRTDSLVSRIIAESGKSRNNLAYDDKKTIARSQSTADRKKREAQEAARAANIAREKSTERAMGSANYAAYQARGRR